MTRLRILVLALAVLALAAAPGAALAGSYPKPPLGAWKLEPSGGFTLKNGSGPTKGQVILANLRFRSPSEELCAPAGTVKVLGAFPLKQFHRGGYTAWGVGKNAGGEPTYMAAKMVLGGKTLNGSFYLLWNYQDPGQVLSGSAKFGDCTLEFLVGAPK